MRGPSAIILGLVATALVACAGPQGTSTPEAALTVAATSSPAMPAERQPAPWPTPAPTDTATATRPSFRASRRGARGRADGGLLGRSDADPNTPPDEDRARHADANVDCYPGAETGTHSDTYSCVS